MKNLFATVLLSFFYITSVTGLYIDINTSYDYFRGLPDGSWNGNNGVLAGANCGYGIYDQVTLQAGGSYGLYNFDGRGNVVFADTRKLEQIGFVTSGLTASSSEWNMGIVYDCMFSNNYSIYCVSPFLDQLRMQIGYISCADELGLWGTVGLSKKHEDALGVPISFRAIGQVNLYWTHSFNNLTQTSFWVGLPYQNSLLYNSGTAGKFIAGFSFKVPLENRLSIEGNASYMAARSSSGVSQSRNYAANICLGLTYAFWADNTCADESPLMSIANHSNFLVDISSNQ